MSRITRFVLPAGLLLLAVGVAACGDSMSGNHDAHSMTNTATASTPAADGTTGGVFNDADVRFATGMIPHHAQAIQMADLATDRATAAEVKQLAGAIRAAQDPEITTMSGWLTSWGKPVPATTGEHAGHDMTGSMTGSMDGSMGASMSGMMTQQEMDQLGGATGADFDRMWLTMMIKHHQGAIAMAKDEIAAGTYQPAKDLARSIEASQGEEIATMQQLLTRLR